MLNPTVSTIDFKHKNIFCHHEGSSITQQQGTHPARSSGTKAGLCAQLECKWPWSSLHSFKQPNSLIITHFCNSADLVVLCYPTDFILLLAHVNVPLKYQ